MNMERIRKKLRDELQKRSKGKKPAKRQKNG
jgi:hypothetical protein